MELDDDAVTTLQAIFIAFDELNGQWPLMEAAMKEFGITDPEEDWERLRALAFGGG